MLFQKTIGCLIFVKKNDKFFKNTFKKSIQAKIHPFVSILIICKKFNFIFTKTIAQIKIVVSFTFNFKRQLNFFTPFYNL